MWINKNGQLIQSIDTTRKKFKTTVSNAVLESLEEIAKENYTNISFLLETGYERVLLLTDFTYDKKARPKDRRDFRSTCNIELLEKIKQFAKQHNVNLNDVIEVAAKYIEPEKAKRENHRYRIEKQY